MSGIAAQATEGRDTLQEPRRHFLADAARERPSARDAQRSCRARHSCNLMFAPMHRNSIVLESFVDIMDRWAMIAVRSYWKGRRVPWRPFMPPRSSTRAAMDGRLWN